MSSSSKTALAALILSLFCCAGLAAQQVQYIPAEADGDGATESDAIQTALRECIAQVNGKSIADETSLQIVAVTLTASGSDSSKAQEKLNRRIDTATKGRVSSYKILRGPQKTDLGTEVRVAAQIPKYQTGQDDRRRLAFMPLRAAREYYVCDNEQIPAAAVSSQLLHALSQKIVSARKFMVLDREYTDEIATEMGTVAQSTDDRDLSKLGATLGADYIIVGTIENFGVKTDNQNVGGIAVTRKMGDAAIALRVLDVATGQIKFSDTINTTMPIKRDASSASMDLGDQVADASASKIMQAIYPVLVLSVGDGELVLNQGGDLVKVGDRYELFALNENLKDPRTGESLGRREEKVGVIEIIRSKPKTSDAKIIENYCSLQEIAKTQQLLCRPLAKEKAQPTSLKQQATKEQLW